MMIGQAGKKLVEMTNLGGWEFRRFEEFGENKMKKGF